MSRDGLGKWCPGAAHLGGFDFSDLFGALLNGITSPFTAPPANLGAQLVNAGAGMGTHVCGGMVCGINPGSLPTRMEQWGQHPIPLGNPNSTEYKIWYYGAPLLLGGVGGADDELLALGGRIRALVDAEKTVPGTSVVVFRDLTEHALEQAGERTIYRRAALLAIRKGTPYWDFKNQSVIYVLANGGRKTLIVAVNPFEEWVNTVMWNRRFNPDALFKGAPRYFPLDQ
jgi:hypothetical protein